MQPSWTAASLIRLISSYLFAEWTDNNAIKCKFLTDETIALPKLLLLSSIENVCKTTDAT